MPPRVRVPLAALLMLVTMISASCSASNAASGTATPSITAVAATTQPALATTPPPHPVTQRSPIPIPTGTPTQVLPTMQPFATPTACTADSQFVADVTIPDNTPEERGKSFTKTWRIRNNGTC